MKSHALMAAALLVTSSLLAETASAGSNGVSLSFGGPMGTFVATPARGGSARTPARSYVKPSPVYTAARATPPAAKKSVVAKRIDTPQPAPDNSGAAEPKVNAPDAAASSASASTEPAAVTSTSATAAFLQHEVPAAATSGAATAETGKRQDVAAAADPAPETSPAAAPASSITSTKPATEKPLQCKRFIPAVGTTISVACSE